MSEQLYGLYEERVCDGDRHTTLKGVDLTEEALVIRWNNDIQRQLDAVEGLHADYRQRIEPKIDLGKLEVRFNGNTGGGYSSVSCRVWIEPLRQFDDAPTPKATFFISMES